MADGRAHVQFSGKNGVSAHEIHRTLRRHLQDGMVHDASPSGSHERIEPRAYGRRRPVGTGGRNLLRQFVQAREGLSQGPSAIRRASIALVEPKGRASGRSRQKQRRPRLCAISLVSNVASHNRTPYGRKLRFTPKSDNEFAAHKTVEHGSQYGDGFYVGKDGATTNAVENFFGNFKRSMKGTYRFCGEQHLQRYLNEFQFRHNHRAKLGFTDGERTAAALKGIEGKRLTYRPTDGGKSLSGLGTRRTRFLRLATARSKPFVLSACNRSDSMQSSMQPVIREDR